MLSLYADVVVSESDWANEPIRPESNRPRSTSNEACTFLKVAASPPLSGWALSTIRKYARLMTANSSSRVAQRTKASAATLSAAKQLATVDMVSASRPTAAGSAQCPGLFEQVQASPLLVRECPRLSQQYEITAAAQRTTAPAPNLSAALRPHSASGSRSCPASQEGLARRGYSCANERSHSLNGALWHSDGSRLGDHDLSLSSGNACAAFHDYAHYQAAPPIEVRQQPLQYERRSSPAAATWLVPAWRAALAGH